MVVLCTESWKARLTNATWATNHSQGILGGNAHQIPSTGLYKQLVPVTRVHRFAKLDFDFPLRMFREWSKQYGSVFTLKLGSANVVLLFDRKAIHKLLVEKRFIYSDRPGIHVGKLLTKGDHLAL
jgi:hypothetical protein